MCVKIQLLYSSSRKTFPYPLECVTGRGCRTWNRKCKVYVISSILQLSSLDFFLSCKHSEAASGSTNSTVAVLTVSVVKELIRRMKHSCAWTRSPFIRCQLCGLLPHNWYSISGSLSKAPPCGLLSFHDFHFILPDLTPLFLSPQETLWRSREKKQRQELSGLVESE